MDSDVKELKAQMREVLRSVEDTNRLVRKMRRAALWGMFLQMVWWVAIIVVSSAAYYYYLQPYVDRLVQLYSQVESTGQQTPTFGQDVQHFIQNLGSTSKQQ